MLLCSVAVILTIFSKGFSQEDDGPYRGKYLGKLNSYHHQVAGDVYAVDEYTILLTLFSYDGNGADTFFWAGASNRPGPQGFIVPDEFGKTNVLKRYFNKDFTLTLPDKKKITDIQWFAIYDLGSQNTFGDVYIPEEFEPPSTQKLSELTSKTNSVSGTLEILDAKRVKIIDFKHDGKSKNAYFWVGVGASPDIKGFKVPDEFGYLDAIRKYDGETIILELPGNSIIFEIDWFSIYDIEKEQNLGSIIIPDGLNVPPSLITVIPHKNDLPNCLQLHKNFQVSWEVFGPQVTIELAGQVKEDEYMSFGISGSTEQSQMMGADVAVAYMDGYRWAAADYNITALTPCVKVLGQYKGVCKDELVGGQDNNQMFMGIRKDGINIITFRRTLISADNGDKEYPTDGSSVFVVWAMGRLDENKEPSFHDIYPKSNISVAFAPKEPISNCFSFTRSTTPVLEPWRKGQIYDKTIRVLNAYLGPSAGKKGYQTITGHTSTALAWYINGFLAPELWLRRGLTYAFRVFGGNNPHSAEFYHPLIITDDPHGGYDRLTDAGQTKVRVLAGVEYTRRGRPRPLAAGPLCLSEHKTSQDRRLDDLFPTFKSFNRSLTYSCEKGDPAVLEITPNTSWPDIVYYNSFTQANMGWKIHIIDSFSGRSFAENKYNVISTWLIVLMVVLGNLFV